MQTLMAPALALMVAIAKAASRSADTYSLRATNPIPYHRRRNKGKDEENNWRRVCQELNSRGRMLLCTLAFIRIYVLTTPTTLYN